MSFIPLTVAGGKGFAGLDPMTTTKARTAVALLVAAVVGLAGCASGRPQTSNDIPPDDTARPARDLPERFVFPDPPVGTVCQSPIGDPRTGARLRLGRSFNGRGDYEVPAGFYGARASELLRVDCTRGNALGLVRR